jgi:hypothetical protein
MAVLQSLYAEATNLKWLFSHEKATVYEANRVYQLENRSKELFINKGCNLK